LWGVGLLEDLNTKNTAKDNNYIIKCCEFCKYQSCHFDLYFGINPLVVPECNQNGCWVNFED
jgi:hypothetical protein